MLDTASSDVVVESIIDAFEKPFVSADAKEACEKMRASLRRSSKYKALNAAVAEYEKRPTRNAERAMRDAMNQIDAAPTDRVVQHAKTYRQAVERYYLDDDIDLRVDNDVSMECPVKVDLGQHEWIEVKVHNRDSREKSLRVDVLGRDDRCGIAEHVQTTIGDIDRVVIVPLTVNDKLDRMAATSNDEGHLVDVVLSEGGRQVETRQVRLMVPERKLIEVTVVEPVRRDEDRTIRAKVGVLNRGNAALDGYFHPIFDVIPHWGQPQGVAQDDEPMVLDWHQQRVIGVELPVRKASFAFRSVGGGVAVRVAVTSGHPPIAAPVVQESMLQPIEFAWNWLHALIAMGLTAVVLIVLAALTM